MGHVELLASCSPHILNQCNGLPPWNAGKQEPPVPHESQPVNFRNRDRRNRIQKPWRSECVGALVWFGEGLGEVGMQKQVVDDVWPEKSWFQLRSWASSRPSLEFFLSDFKTYVNYGFQRPCHVWYVYGHVRCAVHVCDVCVQCAMHMRYARAMRDAYVQCARAMCDALCGVRVRCAMHICEVRVRCAMNVCSGSKRSVMHMCDIPPWVLSFLWYWIYFHSQLIADVEFDLMESNVRICSCTENQSNKQSRFTLIHDSLKTQKFRPKCSQSKVVSGPFSNLMLISCNRLRTLCSLFTVLLVYLGVWHLLSPNLWPRKAHTPSPGKISKQHNKNAEEEII